MDNTLEKIFSKVNKLDSGCWEWTRCLNTDGYPRMYYKGSANGKVHRILMELLGNDISNCIVRHRCDNPKCLNPEHLELGSVLDNVVDRVERGRTAYQISELERKAILSLLESGLTGVQVAQILGIQPKRVYYVKTKCAAHTGGL